MIWHENKVNSILKQIRFWLCDTNQKIGFIFTSLVTIEIRLPEFSVLILVLVVLVVYKQTWKHNSYSGSYSNRLLKREYLCRTLPRPGPKSPGHIWSLLGHCSHARPCHRARRISSDKLFSSYLGWHCWVGSCGAGWGHTSPCHQLSLAHVFWVEISKQPNLFQDISYLIHTNMNINLNC